ncbi:hypothetical protein F5Y14DRAFT_399636 [Nemania sp. NC0429]|nr:hypothetical protein F5Y14DRAFT_399636 [Nemania sp. NC0429]
MACKPMRDGRRLIVRRGCSVYRGGRAGCSATRCRTQQQLAFRGGETRLWRDFEQNAPRVVNQPRKPPRPRRPNSRQVTLLLIQLFSRTAWKDAHYANASCRLSFRFAISRSSWFISVSEGWLLLVVHAEPSTPYSLGIAHPASRQGKNHRSSITGRDICDEVAEVGPKSVARFGLVTRRVAINTTNRAWPQACRHFAAGTSKRLPLHEKDKSTVTRLRLIYTRVMVTAEFKTRCWLSACEVRE